MRPNWPLCDDRDRAGTTARRRAGVTTSSTRTGDLVDHRRRNADIGDAPPPDPAFRRREHVRQLRRGERDGDRGLDRLTRNAGRIGRQSARQINGHDRDACRIHILDDCAREACERRGEPGPGDGVDHNHRVLERTPVARPRRGVGELDDIANGTQTVERIAGVALDAVERADHQHLDVGTLLHERARRYEPVAAVIAAPAQHDDRLAGDWWRIRRTTAAATCCPARSIRSRAGIPRSSMVRRSASRICPALSTRME